MQLQQGDTVYQSVKGIPEGAKGIERKQGAVVIAEGEMTGHAHRIFDADAFLYELNGKRYLKTTKDIQVLHEEHNPITIPTGVYEIGQVREKDWLTGMVAPVVD